MPNIHGKITNQSGQSVENATITIPAVAQFALSDENGVFEIFDIPSGLYTIYVVHRDYQKFGGDLRIINDFEVTIELDR